MCELVVSPKMSSSIHSFRLCSALLCHSISAAAAGGGGAKRAFNATTGLLATDQFRFALQDIEGRRSINASCSVSVYSPLVAVPAGPGGPGGAASAANMLAWTP